MLFEGEKIILCHGVVDLRKGAAGLLALLDEPERGTWYLFSNRSRSLMKCLCTDGRGAWVASRRLNHGHVQWLERAAGSSVITLKNADRIAMGEAAKIYD